LHPHAAAIESGNLDLARLAATPLVREPFDHVIVPEFLVPAAASAVARDFPEISHGGSFPARGLACGAAFEALLQELHSPQLAAALSEKFDLDLADRPVMITVRGLSRLKDGRIHADSDDKLLTGLIYINDGWQSEGGRLRLLRSPDDMEDYVAEIPPHQGTLLAFRCAEHAWHGHKPYAGVRRSIQINWMRDERVVRRELARHGFAARVKRLFSWRWR
jgi:hypothetical protein